MLTVYKIIFCAGLAAIAGLCGVLLGMLEKYLEDRPHD